MSGLALLRRAVLLDFNHLLSETMALVAAAAPAADGLSITSTERLEKRDFVLHLSAAELAALSAPELQEFYEFLRSARLSSMPGLRL